MINVNSKLIKEDLAILGPNAFAVLMAITIHINAKRTAFPGVNRLCSITGLSRTTIYTAIAVLIQNGYLERWQENNNGKFGKTIYRITTKYLSVFISADGAELEENTDQANEEHTVYQNTVHGSTVHGNTVSGKNGHISINKKGSINKNGSISYYEDDDVGEKITQEDIDDFEKQAEENARVIQLQTRQEEKEKSCAKKEKDSGEKYGDQLLDDEIFLEYTCMSKKITPQQFNDDFQEFVKQKRALGELTHKNYQDFKRNFLFWIGKKPQQQHDNAKNNRPVSDATVIDVYQQLKAEGYF